jgi:hypothetical protein
MKFLYVFDSTADALHYVVLFSALLLAWPYVMDKVAQNLYLTSIIVFAIFVSVDKIEHSVLKV